jgi:putative ABC transport system permease protein
MFWQQLTHPIFLGAQTLRMHKLRSLLTILGVVFGVASVVVMLAVGEGARSEAIEAINQLGATNIIVRSVKPSDQFVEAGAIRYGLSLSDMKRIKDTVPTIAVITPTRDHRRDLRHLDRHLEGRVVGVTPDYQTLHDLRLAAGRFIDEIDVARATLVTVLAAQTAETLFPLTDPLGEFIRIGEDQYYEVVGVAQPMASTPDLGSDLPAQDYNRDAYIPFTTDQKRFGENIVFDRADSSRPPEKVEISQITFSVYRTDQVKPTARIVEAVLQQADKQEETAMTVPLDLLEQAEKTHRIFTWFLTAIASISLLVGGIGIMNIMLATVTERTREIGIRRAIGARRSDIVFQFLIETTILSCTGGLLGVALGVGGAFLASQLTGVATLVRPWSPLLAFAISFAIGLVFGTYPARRAARMDPVEALRHE